MKRKKIVLWICFVLLIVVVIVSIWKAQFVMTAATVASGVCILKLCLKKEDE